MMVHGPHDPIYTLVDRDLLYSLTVKIIIIMKNQRLKSKYELQVFIYKKQNNSK